MRKQTPMQFVDSFFRNLANNYEEANENVKAQEVTRLHKQFESLVEEENKLIKKAFIDGYESAIDAHSTKAEILAELYIKEKFK